MNKPTFMGYIFYLITQSHSLSVILDSDWWQAMHTSGCHNPDVGALGIRLWDGVWHAGCLLRSALERLGKEAGLGEGNAKLWSRPNSSLSHHQGSYGTRMTFLSHPELGQDHLPLVSREKIWPYAEWLSTAEATPEGVYQLKVACW